MKVEVISGRDLTPELVACWAQIQKTDPALVSPYFRPEFTQAVAAVRDDVQIGILRDHNESIGFFPFHHKRGGVARPIGLGLSDYQGIIAKQNTKWTTEELLLGCNLIRWEFDHLLTSQKQFAAFHNQVSCSPIIDVSQGIDTFESSLDKAGRKQLKEAQRKQKKLESEVGPVTITLHSQDKAILRQLIQWKSQQCQQTGTEDFFALEWCVQLIEHIHATRGNNFGGMLSCLHAGDTLAAVHFTMYSKEVWHSWFPAYNNELLNYSPGTILLFELIRSAAKRNIHYIDLGKGMSLYKKRVMTGNISVAEGLLKVSSPRNKIYHFISRVEQWSQQSTKNPFFKIPGRVIQRIKRKRRYK